MYARTTEEKKRIQRRARRRKRQIRRRAVTCLVLISAMFILIGIYSKSQDNRTNTALELLKDQGSIPQSLLELAERNPEAMQFVLDYPTNHNSPANIDLSGEVTLGEIPLFLQWDERWGYEIYGDDFIAVTGCGPTCLSMVYCGLTGNTDQNPYEVACEAEAGGYYVSGKGSSWDMMTGLASKLGLQAASITFDENHIREALEEGRPIICIMGPGDFTTSGHFIVLSGIDADGKIIVRDPNSRINSEKTWDLETLMPQIRNLWAYKI